MKKLNGIVGGIILCSSLSFGQTNVIALKSHAGTTAELLEQDDNFGLPDPSYEYRYVDSVKYVKKEKIVESAVTGKAVKALCGKKWIPSRDPEKYPICPTCKEIHAGLKPDTEEK